MRADMRQRDSVSVENSECAAPKALIALVRLLACQAARDFVVQQPASHSKGNLTRVIPDFGGRLNLGK